MKTVRIVFVVVPFLLFAQSKPRNPVTPSGSWANGLIRAYLFSRADSVAQDSVRDWSPKGVWAVLSSTSGTTWLGHATHGPIFDIGLSGQHFTCGNFMSSGVDDSISVFGVFNDRGSGIQRKPAALYDRYLTPDNVLYFRDDDASFPFDWQFGVYTTSLVEAVADSIPNDSSSPYDSLFSILGTYDGSNVRVYRNGVLQDTKPQTGQILVTNYEFDMARSASSGGFVFWNGIYSALYVWNRVLTTSEIAALRSDPYVMFKAQSGQNNTTHFMRRRLF